MSNPIQFPPNCLWFDMCDMYLHELEVVDGTVTLYDNLPNVTKAERKTKMDMFDRLMMYMHTKDCVEAKINETWGLD